MSCKLCDGDIEESKYGNPQCVNCGARNPEDFEWVEVRDAVVKMWTVGSHLDDPDPEWDEEKMFTVYWGGDDLNLVYNTGNVYNNEHQFTDKGVDEFIVAGAAIHGKIHGDLIGRFPKVRVLPGTEDTLPYIEMSCGHRFRNLRDR